MHYNTVEMAQALLLYDNVSELLRRIIPLLCFNVRARELVISIATTYNNVPIKVYEMLYDDIIRQLTYEPSPNMWEYLSLRDYQDREDKIATKELDEMARFLSGVDAPAEDKDDDEYELDYSDVLTHFPVGSKEYEFYELTIASAYRNNAMARQLLLYDLHRWEELGQRQIILSPEILKVFRDYMGIDIEIEHYVNAKQVDVYTMLHNVCWRPLGDQQDEHNRVPRFAYLCENAIKYTRGALETIYYSSETVYDYVMTNEKWFNDVTEYYLSQFKPLDASIHSNTGDRYIDALISTYNIMLSDATKNVGSVSHTVLRLIGLTNNILCGPGPIDAKLFTELCKEYGDHMFTQLQKLGSNAT
jgi:hypothetical protein